MLLAQQTLDVNFRTPQSSRFDDSASSVARLQLLPPLREKTALEAVIMRGIIAAASGLVVSPCNYTLSLVAVPWFTLQTSPTCMPRPRWNAMPVMP